MTGDEPFRAFNCSIVSTSDGTTTVTISQEREDNIRVVTKISSSRVNTSRRGIKRLEISFGSIFLLFSNKSSRGTLS